MNQHQYQNQTRNNRINNINNNNNNSNRIINDGYSLTTNYRNKLGIEDKRLHQQHYHHHHHHHHRP